MLAGSVPDQLEPLVVPHQGFETMITLHTTEPYVGLNRIEQLRQVLGASKAVELEDRT